MHARAQRQQISGDPMASGENQKLDYGRELVYVDQKDQLLGRLLKRVIDGVNQLAHTPTPTRAHNQVFGSLH